LSNPSERPEKLEATSGQLVVGTLTLALAGARVQD